MKYNIILHKFLFRKKGENELVEMKQIWFQTMGKKKIRMLL